MAKKQYYNACKCGGLKPIPAEWCFDCYIEHEEKRMKIFAGCAIGVALSICAGLATLPWWVSAVEGWLK